MAIDSRLPPYSATQRGQQPCQRCLGTLVESPDQVGAPLGERIERVHERRVGHPTLPLLSGAAQRVEPKLLRPGEHNVDEARLANPERSRDKQRTPIAGRGALKRDKRRGKLSLPPFDRSVKEPRRADGRPRGESPQQRRVFARWPRAEPGELVAQQAESTRCGPPVAAGRVA